MQTDAHNEEVAKDTAARRVRPKSWTAYFVCHVLVRCVAGSCAVWPRRRAQGRVSTPARIVLTGKFFADNWIAAHIRPLALANACAHVWVVSDRPFSEQTKVTYVCPPNWLKRLVGNVPARLMLFTWTAIRRRADIVGGFHLLLNGLSSLVVARLAGAQAMYFCVGGPAEFLDGGLNSENRLFTRIGCPDVRLERWLLKCVRRFDRIVTMGHGARRFLKAAGVSSPIEVMSGGIDASRFALGGEEQKYDLIAVSRIVPIKRYDVLLRVVERLRDSHPSIRVAILGDGEEMESMQSLSGSLGLGSNVFFVGRQTNVGEWLSASRVFVLTSDSEGLSLAMMEAMMAGLPAVVSDVGDLRDLVRSGENGWLIPRGDVGQFAERIGALLCDAALYRNFSAAAHEGAMAYSLEATRDRWDRTLSGASASSRGVVAKALQVT